MYLRFALDSLCGQEMILTSSCLYFPSVGVIGMCHHAQFSGCWRNQTRRFVHARQALHQQRYTPSSICPAVWIVGLQGEGQWGRCVLCAVCSSREAAGSLGTRSLPGFGGIYPPGNPVRVWGASPCFLSSCTTFWVFREPTRSVWTGLIHNRKKLSLETERW